MRRRGYLAALSSVSAAIIVRGYTNGDTAPKVETVVTSSPDASRANKVEVEYLPDGERRVTHLGAVMLDGVQLPAAVVLQWCDNNNLNSQTTGAGDDSLIVTPNYLPCADGKLTPSDFPNSPNEIVIAQ